jgi:hypothetical protein
MNSRTTSVGGQATRGREIGKELASHASRRAGAIVTVLDVAKHFFMNFMNCWDFVHFPSIKCQCSETSIAKSPLQRLVAESLSHTRVSRQKYLVFGPLEGITALEMANLW